MDSDFRLIASDYRFITSGVFAETPYRLEFEGVLSSGTKNILRQVRPFILA